MKTTSSSFANKTIVDIPENAVIETEEIREVVLGCNDSCLGSDREKNVNYHGVNVSDSHSELCDILDNREIRENLILNLIETNCRILSDNTQV